MLLLLLLRNGPSACQRFESLGDVLWQYRIVVVPSCVIFIQVHVTYGYDAHSIAHCITLIIKTYPITSMSIAQIATLCVYVEITRVNICTVCLNNSEIEEIL